jgi:hypothetical protein
MNAQSPSLMTSMMLLPPITPAHIGSSGRICYVSFFLSIISLHNDYHSLSIITIFSSLVGRAERLCLGLSTAGVLLITWTDEWNAAVQATTTNHNPHPCSPGCTSLDVPMSIHAF